MLAVLTTLTPGRRNEFINCQKAKVRIAVLPITDVKTLWNSTLQSLERIFRLHEFTQERLKNPKSVITGHSSQLKMNGPL